MLPAAFVERMGRQLGDELPDFLQAMEQPSVRGIRMNPEKPFSGMETYMRDGEIPWTESGFFLSSDSSAGATVFHEAGAFYLQEPAAMLPAEVMDVRPGERILDLCSAPGGKATQMALKLKGEGLIICNDPIPKRAAVLSRNLERMGIVNGIVTCCYPEQIPESWNSSFDGVLVDAPCSGEGMFRREPESRNEWTPEQAAGCAVRQTEILQRAAALVRPGGRLVYSTCTYNPEENEITVQRFLKEHPEFDTEPFNLPGTDGGSGMMLCLPHKFRGEGQFVAKLRKAGTSGFADFTCPFDRPSRTENEMFHSLFPGLPDANARFGNILASCPDTPSLKGIRVLRAGLHLAEIRGKVMVPDHAAALGNIRLNVPETPLSPEEAACYAAGLEIPGHVKGWTVMTYRGLRIGWGKGTGETVKNHYPKGLRKENLLTECL